MLVKLGDVWVDPALVVSIQKKGELFGWKNPDREEYSHKISYYLQVEVQDKPCLVINGEEDADKFAAIVNEALAPKQSWGEDISEPEELSDGQL